LIVSLSLCVSLLAGCGWKMEPAPLEARNPATGELFTCEVESLGQAYRSTLQCPGDRPPLPFPGRAEMLAVSGNGDVVAVAVRPMIDGRLGDSSAQRLFLIDVPKQKLIWQWDLQDQNAEKRFLSFRQLALSADAKLIASAGAVKGEGGEELVIWTNAGDIVRRLPLPDYPKSSAGDVPPPIRLINSICFSPGSEKIAVGQAAGRPFSTKLSLHPMPVPEGSDGAIYSWIVASGSLTNCPTKGVAVSRDLCYDAKGENIIAWAQTGKGADVVEIDVWELLTGRLKHQRFVKGKVVGITPSPEGDSWRVLMEDKSEIVVPYP